MDITERMIFGGGLRSGESEDEDDREQPGDPILA
jgi:hypothetical protein